MSTTYAITLLKKQLNAAKTPAEIERIKHRLDQLEASKRIVAGPVAQNSFGGDGVTMYVFIKDYEGKLRSKNGKTFFVRTYKHCIPYLPFVKAVSGKNIIVSNDLNTVTFLRNGEPFTAIHTMSSFALTYIGSKDDKIGGDIAGGWHIAYNVRLPQNIGTRYDGTPFYSFSFDRLKAIGGTIKAPNALMIAETLTRLYGGIRCPITPFPKGLLPDLKEVESLAQKLFDNNKTKPPQNAASSSSSSAEAPNPVETTEETTTGISAQQYNLACKQLCAAIIMGGGLYDPHDVGSYIINDRQIIVPLTYPLEDESIIIDNFDTMALVGPPQYAEPPYRTDKGVRSTKGDYGCTNVVRFGLNVARPYVDEYGVEHNVQITVRGNNPVAGSYYSQVMGLVNEMTVAALRVTPVAPAAAAAGADDDKPEMVCREFHFGAVAIGPLQIYRTIKEQSDSPTESVMESTPFTGFSNVIAAYRKTGVLIDKLSAMRFLRAFCFSHKADNLPSEKDLEVAGISICSILDTHGADCVAHMTNETSQFHLRSNGWAFCLTESAFFYDRPKTGPVLPNGHVHTHALTSEFADRFRFYLVANVAHKGQAEYNALHQRFYSLANGHPDKAELADEINRLAQDHGKQLLKLRNNKETETFTLCGEEREKMVFALIAINRKLDDKAFYDELTVFSHPKYTEEALQKKRGEVALINSKRQPFIKRSTPSTAATAVVINTTIAADDLAAVEEAERLAADTSGTSGTSLAGAKRGREEITPTSSSRDIDPDVSVTSVTGSAGDTLADDDDIEDEVPASPSSSPKKGTYKPLTSTSGASSTSSTSGTGAMDKKKKKKKVKAVPIVTEEDEAEEEEEEEEVEEEEEEEPKVTIVKIKTAAKRQRTSGTSSAGAKRATKSK